MFSISKCHFKLKSISLSIDFTVSTVKKQSLSWIIIIINQSFFHANMCRVFPFHHIKYQIHKCWIYFIWLTISQLIQVSSEKNMRHLFILMLLIKSTQLFFFFSFWYETNELHHMHRCLSIVTKFYTHV